MRRVAMNSLAASLAYNDHQEDALPIHEAALDTVLHQYPTLQSDNPRDVPVEAVQSCMAMQTSIATTLSAVGRHDEAINRHRKIHEAKERYFRADALEGSLMRADGRRADCACLAGIADTFALDNMVSVQNFTHALIAREPRSTALLREARSLMRTNMAAAERVYGPDNENMLMFRGNYARSIYLDEGASEDDLREANEIADDIRSTARRVFGNEHPLTRMVERLGYSDSEYSDSESTVDASAPEPDPGARCRLMYTSSPRRFRLRLKYLY